VNTEGNIYWFTE